jgi:hypothetical protein
VEKSVLKKKHISQNGTKQNTKDQEKLKLNTKLCFKNISAIF